MRILVLSLHFAPDTVSNAVVVTDLAEELAARGHQVTVIAAVPYHQAHRIEPGFGRRVWQTDTHRGVRVRRTWLWLSGGKRQVGRRFLAYGSFNLTSTAAAFAAGRHDVVLTPSPPLTIGLSGWLLARWWRAAFIYNVQDIYPDAAVSLGLLRNKRLIRAFSWLERFVYGRANAISVISDDFRQNLLLKGVRESKIAVIPNPVDTDFVQPLPRINDFAKAHGLANSFVALYAGNIGLAQGLETLVEAAALTRAKDRKFVIVGNGAALTDVRALANARNATNLLFMPFQSRASVPTLYASSDVGIVMLRKGLARTSTPSKLYTIMSAGRAAVAAVDPSSEVWRLVEAIGCGVCVPPEDPHALADALDKLAADPSNTRALGERGRAYVERVHTRRRVADQYEQLMCQLQGAAPLQ